MTQLAVNTNQLQSSDWYPIALCLYVRLEMSTSIISYWLLFPDHASIRCVSYALSNDLSQRCFEVSGAIVHALSAGLLQRCTCCNSWHSNKTAVSSTEYRDLFTVESMSLQLYVVLISTGFWIIVFKTAVLVKKCVHGVAPAYRFLHCGT